jgi:hypothetical protein
VQYCLGCALQKGGHAAEAKDAFERAAAGTIEPSYSMSYNDQPADMLFFQGLALARLLRPELARARFRVLVDYSERNREAVISIDYFAVSLPDFLIFDDDLMRRNRIFCACLEGFGRLGLAVLAERDGGGGGDRQAGFAHARSRLESVVVEDPSHSGAREILRDLENGWEF